VRYLVPHQANLRIIDATARRMGLEHEKCMINIDENSRFPETQGAPEYAEKRRKPSLVSVSL